MTKLQMGLIGGGGSGFIGRVHAVAATLDLRADLVAGALSSDSDRAREAVPAFGIGPDLAYGSYQELLDQEQQRLDFVSVATPNYTHCEIAAAALEAGYHVFCDKPLAINTQQAEALAEVVQRTGRVFVLTHNYSGYPLVRQARQMVLEGELGQIQAVRVSYVQGWLKTWSPDLRLPRGAWKSDPELAGPSGALADIGTHAFHLARFVTDLQPVRLRAHLTTFQPDWPLDDYGHALVQCESDALISVTVSQVTSGRSNDLTLEVDGHLGSLLWRQERPNQLEVRQQGAPRRTYQRNPRATHLAQSQRAACRIPAGHPEGFFEAFANVYCSGFAAIERHRDGRPPDTTPLYPTVHDGLEGVRFVEECVASSREDGTWRPFEPNWPVTN